MAKLKTKETQKKQQEPQNDIPNLVPAQDLESEDSRLNDYSNRTAPIRMFSNGGYPPDNNNTNQQHIRFSQKVYGNLATLRFQQFDSANQTRANHNKPKDKDIYNGSTIPTIKHKTAQQYVVQRKPKSQEKWNDMTRGLTLKQKKILAPALNDTAWLQSNAVKPPDWKALNGSTIQIGIIVGDVLSQKKITSLAKLTLSPASQKVLVLSDLIKGASASQEVVFGGVENRIETAEAQLAELLAPIILGGIDISDRDTFEKKIEELRKNDFRMEGSRLKFKDEASLRQTYEPLTNLQKAEVRGIKSQVSLLTKDASKQRPNLRLILEELHFVLDQLDNFILQNPMRPAYLASVQIARTSINQAINMIVGKIAPVENTLHLVRQHASEIQSIIQGTLELATAADPDTKGDPTKPAVPHPKLDRLLQDKTPEQKLRPERKAINTAPAKSDNQQTLEQANQSIGQPLPIKIRNDLESGLRTNLSAVRIHTGQMSDRASNSINANAYTIGNNIHFASGQYSPESSAGRELIAHEVVHTVQQAKGATTIRSDKTVELSQSSDPTEIEADNIAKKIINIPGAGQHRSKSK
ncbi:MAG: DUF4157 domain-containing protein [Bacteroidetes bacterium]|nr:DUF4157 domain-containing protein [Bacteroidota bacterium]